MPKSIREKVKSSFSQGSEENKYVKEYLTELRTNWRDTEKTITRTGSLIVAIGVIFELTLTGGATAGSILGFKISNLDFIRFALPVILAYLFSSVTFSLIESEIFAATHDAIIETLYEHIYDNALERPLYPANSLQGSVDRIYYHLGPDTLAGKLSQVTGGVKVVAIMFAPPLFGIATYIQLFAKFGFANILLWVSFVISSALFASGIVNWYIFSAVDR